MGRGKKALSIILATLITGTSLTGCSSILKQDPSQLPMVPELSEKEVVDYYKKAMEYDTVVSKNLDIHEVQYETVDVSESKRKTLESLVRQVESVLGRKEFPDDDYETAEFLNPNIYYYIKTLLDDKVLTNSNVVAAKEALGFYFVDVEYSIKSASPGQFTDKAAFLGLNGAFKELYDGTDTIDTTFMKRAATELNRYYTENRISKQVTFDESGLRFYSTNTGSSPDFTNGGMSDAPTPEVQDENTDDITNTENTNKTENTDEIENTDDTENETHSEPENTQNINLNSGEVVETRYPLIDVNEFNSVVGSALGNAAYVPELNIVYSIPEPQGTISGYCIYPSGDNALRKYAGFNRSNMDGTITLRYVFKDDVLEPTKIVPVNIYPLIWDINKGINTDLEVIIPEFVSTEIQKLIERSDRAICNKDISALMNGKIYTDMGKAVLVGFESEHVNVTKNMSTLRRVLSRPKDENGKYLNTYIVLVETYRQEGPKGINSLGTYKDTYYMSIEQRGTEFVITDSVLMSRIMDKEPPINTDDAITKRLVALNLAGPITDESRVGIKELLNSLYDASTARQMSSLEEPKQVNVNGQSVTLTRGIDDCFDSDVALLASSRRDYLISQLVEQLVKHGTDVSSRYTGCVTSWMGAADRQAELTTEEVIVYEGRNTGRYMKVYYLVSRMNDTWVIDEMQILESEDKSGDELVQLVNRIDSSRNAE